MSRTSIVINTGPTYDLTISKPNTRGSDWGDFVSPPSSVIPAGTTGASIGSIGYPAESEGETNHWGWIFFTLTQAGGGGVPIAGQLFIELTHSSVTKTCLGAFEANSSDSNPCPDQNFGSITVDKQPPAGRVTYTIPT